MAATNGLDVAYEGMGMPHSGAVCNENAPIIKLMGAALGEWDATIEARHKWTCHIAASHLWPRRLHQQFVAEETKAVRFQPPTPGAATHADATIPVLTNLRILAQPATKRLPIP